MTLEGVEYTSYPDSSFDVGEHTQSAGLQHLF